MSAAFASTDSTPALTSIAFIKTILLAYEWYGVGPGTVLDSAQIPPALLDNSDGKITAAQLESFTAGPSMN